MEALELLSAMVDVAESAGIEVRGLGSGAVTDGGPSAESGVVQLRGRVIVMLSRSEPLEERLEILSRALRQHAGAWLESNFVAPAVRERVTPR